MGNSARTSGDVALIYLLIVSYAATIPVANWMIQNFGVCHDSGPCIIPVGFGLFAPSGVVMVGLALALRDAVHERLGMAGAIAAVAFGSILSAFVAPTSLVVASVSAFVFSEIADLAVYSPLRRRSLVSAVLVSGLVGSIIDSGVFLYVAFGSFEFIAGQLVGKFWATIAAGLFLLFCSGRFKDA